MTDRAIIFSDGSSRGNPGPGGWGAIVSYHGKVTELGGREAHTTNNRMELLASIRALESLGGKTSKLEVVVYTDSAYVINGITKWVKGWQKNNWKTKGKTDVLNKDLWIALLDVAESKTISWKHIDGHAGIPGNERADVIATEYADNKKPELFSGDASAYIHDLSETKASKSKPKKNRNTSSAYAYLSLVNGVFHRDSDWKSCEARVKKVKGNVRFKKALSAADEQNIKKAWGIR